MWTHLLFWPWHMAWVFGVLFGIAPFVLPLLLADAVVGEVPWGITASALAIVAWPPVILVLGWRLRSDYRKLLRLFYGVGGVGFSLLLVRLFFIREATAGVDLLLLTLAAGMVFYAAELFDGLDRLGSRGLAVRMVGSSALLVIGIYVGITMGLYCIPGIVLAVPATFVGIYEVLTEMRWRDAVYLLSSLPFIFAFLAIAFYGAVIVLGLPFALAVQYPAAWWRAFGAWKRAGRSPIGAVAITFATLAVWLVAFAVTSRQSQREVLAQLERPPATLEQQAALESSSEEIESALLRAYLAPYRYWGATGTNIQLARLYREAFALDDDWWGIQAFFNRMAAPLLYEGESLHADRSVAELRYEQFFDRPLQEEQREAVLEAISATYDRTQAEAGLLDVGQRRVWLREQDLDVDIQGDIARFTLHEVYENQTPDPQEVFYYFNLPEHAAVTGLWLGDTADESRRFPYTIAPRGAAQSVYREQREQRVDPALLEQVGPRQYRLRAFPIPVRSVPSRWSTSGPTEMHLWLEWSVLSDGTHFPMPQLAEARNIYWTRSTDRTVRGETSSHRDWLPPALEAPERREHAIVVGDLRVTATPETAPLAAPAGRLAVVLDTSRSMAEHAAEVDAVLKAMRERELTADLYLAPSPFSAESPRKVSLEDASPHYFGGHTLLGIVSQFTAVRTPEAYAGIVVLTDAGSFAQRQDEAAPVLGDLGAPLWFVHFGGLPHAYPDAIGDVLQRGGGVTTSFDDALVRMQGGPEGGYRWNVAPAGGGASPATADEAFAAIAAKVAIHHLASESNLDAIHALAVQHSVATPWSSMIVLVNDAQREALARASSAADRFDREAESGVEAPTSPMAALDLTATPEPETWLLIALAAVALYMLRRRRPATLTAST